MSAACGNARLHVTPEGRKEGPKMQREVIRRLGMWRQLVYKLGPYLLLEALMPGGTLLAVLLFLYRGRKRNTGSDAHGPELVATPVTCRSHTIGQLG